MLEFVILNVLPLSGLVLIEVLRTNISTLFTNETRIENHCLVMKQNKDGKSRQISKDFVNQEKTDFIYIKW